MFQSVSMTGTGLALLLLNLLLQMLGAFGIQVDVVPGTLESIVAAGSELVSIFLMVWGQLRRPDLKVGMVRR